MKYTFICLLFLVSGCLLSDYSEGPLLSPDEKYSLTASVNRTNTNSSNYGLVVLEVYDLEDSSHLTLNTRIGDIMKWSVGWYNDSIIVAQSSDIGTSAWLVGRDGLKSEYPSNEMELFAQWLKTEKYGE